MVVIILTNEKGTGIAAVEYSNDNRIKQLRDNRVVEEKIMAQQEKYYKYVN